ncbi:MAK10-like protein [Tanacetum coccineum]
MGDENPIRTLREYYKPSHKGYRNTIELLVGNNVDPSPHGRILLLVSLFNSFHRGRTVKLRNDILMFQQHHGESLSEAWTRPSPQPQALGTTFEAQVRDYMAAHTKKMERFENAIFKQREEINDIMIEITEMVIPLKEAKKNNETKNELIKKAEKEETTEAPSSQPGAVYEAILRKKITRKDDIRGNFEIPGNIGGLKGIAEDVLVEVSEHVYPVDFVILDIKEVEKRPFILRTPFLTTAKSVIKFDKGTITLRSGKSKISFHRIPESPCKIEKGVKNDIEPIAPIMTVIFDEKKLGSS